MQLQDYEIPRLIKISLSSESEKLYDLEDKRNDIIEECAKEQGKILGFNDKQFWTHSLPYQLLALLESWDREASYRASKAYIEFYENTQQ